MNADDNGQGEENDDHQQRQNQNGFVAAASEDAVAITDTGNGGGGGVGGAAAATAAPALAATPMPCGRGMGAAGAAQPGLTAMTSVQPQSLVYEVTAGRPAWSRLSRLATEAVAQIAMRTVNRAIRTHGRAGPGCAAALGSLRKHLWRELPAPTLREVLEACVARDRLR